MRVQGRWKAGAEPRDCRPHVLIVSPMSQSGVCVEEGAVLGVTRAGIESGTDSEQLWVGGRQPRVWWPRS